MVPQPVVGVVMLFPIKEATEEHRAEEAEKIRQSGGAPASDKLYYMYVGKCEGYVGICYSVVNLPLLLRRSVLNICLKKKKERITIYSFTWREIVQS